MTLWNELYTFFWILFSVWSLVAVWFLMLLPFAAVYGIYRLWRWIHDRMAD